MILVYLHNDDWQFVIDALADQEIDAERDLVTAVRNQDRKALRVEVVRAKRIREAIEAHRRIPVPRD